MTENLVNGLGFAILFSIGWAGYAFGFWSLFTRRNDER
jgi:hypothetical protein